ncbi:mitochondrial large subunit ribosomal protein-domain-containing protein [Pyrenochaeta sp. MPI-SDFR-AT-0127]|nr:mitochondrial large subunit ribosomal protein-domain-containing protein [Pyrenochaeta sp. MPI-SDFR-AT-0127]
MSRIQPLMPLLRSLAAPRAVACRQHLRFSTATQLQSKQSSSNTTEPLKASSKPSLPPNASPDAPSTPQQAQRAADLAAAEAVTESDSAQPPEPKPTLPSKRTKVSQPKPIEPTTPIAPKSAFQTNKFKPESRTQKEQRLKNAAKASSSPVSAQTISLPPPKYHISRSASKNLPIYTDYKRGGNLHLTTVRKITGDLSALRDELRVLLNKKNEDVKINSLTGHVIVKGHHTSEIAEFLKARGM